MESKNNSDKLLSVLLKRIKGKSQPDYTLITSNTHSSLYDLAKEYKAKNPGRPLHSAARISEITDPTAQHQRNCPKLWIEAKIVLRLLNALVLQRLLHDCVNIEYNDGKGSYYNPLSITVSIKGAQDLIHEIGHHGWNTWLIREDESEKRSAVNHSLDDDIESRRHLPEYLVPDGHKEYAALVGAHSGQFIENPDKTKTSSRKNDLEEHFARNFDYLMRGRALDVTHHSSAGLDDLLGFFAKYGIVEQKHFSFYKFLLKEGYGKEGLNIVGNPEKAKDGIEITRDEIFQYHIHRISFEAGESPNTLEKISLALDLSEDFIRFCISKEANTEIEDALRQKGITLLKDIIFKEGE